MFLFEEHFVLIIQGLYMIIDSTLSFIIQGLYMFLFEEHFVLIIQGLYMIIDSTLSLLFKDSTCFYLKSTLSLFFKDSTCMVLFEDQTICRSH